MHLVAGGDLGLVFGVYAFLRDVCGCRFCGLGPDGEFIPRHSELRTSIAPTRREPTLWYRSLEFYYFEHPVLLQQVIDWMAKNGFNFILYHFGTEHDESLLNEETDPQTGEKIFPEGMGRSMFSEEFFNEHLLPHIRKRGLKHDFNHHNLCYWLPPALYASDHPEWYAEVNGQRAQKFSQLCLCTSNREAVGELIRRVKAFLRSHPEVRIVGVIPEDGVGMCQCENCRALDDDPNAAFATGLDHRDPGNENRSATRRYALLLNEVARSIRTEFPGVWVGGLAYVSLQWPPRDVTLEDNIAIMVALFWRDGARPLALTHTSELNQFFFRLLQQWRDALGGRLLLYEYYMGMNAQRSLPYPMTRVIGKDWSELRKLPVEGAMIQCTPGCIQSYLLNLLAFSHCAWGQAVDVEEIRNDYLRSVFGAAGPALRPLFARLQLAADELAESGLLPDAKNIAYFWERLDPAQVGQTLKQARSLAVTAKEQKALKDFETYLRYCELAARAMATLQHIERLDKCDPVEAQCLRVRQVEKELPSVIEFLESTRVRGWILPRALASWKHELSHLQRQLDATPVNPVAADPS